MATGKWVKLFRDKRGWSQSKLESLSGIKRTNISAYENDKLPLGSRVAERLAEALGVPPEHLLYGPRATHDVIMPEPDPRRIQDLELVENLDERGRRFLKLWPLLPSYIREACIHLAEGGTGAKKGMKVSRGSGR